MARSKAQRELERLKGEAIKTIANGKEVPSYILDPLMAIPEVAKELEAAKAEQKRKQAEQKEAKTEFVINAALGAYNSLNHLLAGESDGTVLIAKVKEIAQSGDTTAIQEMLTSQALTLQTMFNYWVMVTSKTKNPKAMQGMAHLALKSQEQCRRTLQTLADVKSPKKPSQFIKHYVAQQLNQLQMEQQPKEKISETFSANMSNELDKQNQLEAGNHATVDLGSQRTTSSISSNHETLGFE